MDLQKWDVRYLEFIGSFVVLDSLPVGADSEGGGRSPNKSIICSELKEQQISMYAQQLYSYYALRLATFSARLPGFSASPTSGPRVLYFL